MRNRRAASTEHKNSKRPNIKTTALIFLIPLLLLCTRYSQGPAIVKLWFEIFFGILWKFGSLSFRNRRKASVLYIHMSSLIEIHWWISNKRKTSKTGYHVRRVYLPTILLSPTARTIFILLLFGAWLGQLLMFSERFINDSPLSITHMNWINFLLNFVVGSVTPSRLCPQYTTLPFLLIINSVWCLWINYIYVRYGGRL